MSEEFKKDATLLKKALEEYYQEKQKYEDYVAGVVWKDLRQTVSHYGETILEVVHVGYGLNGRIFHLYPAEGYTIVEGNCCYLLAEDWNHEIRKKPKRRSLLDKIKDIFRKKK
jgi:hypothetical protein